MESTVQDKMHVIQISSLKHLPSQHGCPDTLSPAYRFKNYSHLRPQQLHPAKKTLGLSLSHFSPLVSLLRTRISEWPLDLNIYTVASYAAS